MLLAKFQVPSAPDTCERSATQKCINLPKVFTARVRKEDRRGTNHRCRQKFFLPSHIVGPITSVDDVGDGLTVPSSQTQDDHQEG